MSIHRDTVFKARKDGLEIFHSLKQRINERAPTSLIRLGDGEGTVLGYPDLVTRARVDKFFNIWYGRTNFSESDLLLHHENLKQAVEAADIIGIPRVKQRNISPNWAAVEDALIKYNLVNKNHIITDTAIHRLLTFSLQYRGLLNNISFVGLISCRDLSNEISSTFNVKEVKHYSIQGENEFPGIDTQPHFPDRFNELAQSLEVPFQGAVFLVGAGVLGKTYCHIIKKRGGIAIDIGSICDAWASVPSRTKHPIHKLERYLEVAKINSHEACVRYNDVVDKLGLDTKHVRSEELPADFPSSW